MAALLDPVNAQAADVRGRSLEVLRLVRLSLNLCQLAHLPIGQTAGQSLVLPPQPGDGARRRGVWRRGTYNLALADRTQVGFKQCGKLESCERCG